MKNQPDNEKKLLPCRLCKEIPQNFHESLTRTSLYCHCGVSVERLTLPKCIEKWNKLMKVSKISEQEIKKTHPEDFKT